MPKKPKEPRNAAGWLVEADAMIEAGDPRGELIVLEERIARGGADATARKRRAQLLRKHAAGTKGRVARGVLVAGGGRVGGDAVHERIQDVLLERYSLAHLIAFASGAGAGKTDARTVEERLAVTLPASLHGLYGWARGLAARFALRFERIRVREDGAFGLASVEEIRRDTEMWRTIQREQPDREWRPGFVHVASWGGAYEMILDARGDVAKRKGQLFYWDFKGGSTYNRAFTSYDAYLETILRLLEKEAYFARADADEEEEPDDDDPWFDALRRGPWRSYPFA